MLEPGDPVEVTSEIAALREAISQQRLTIRNERWVIGIASAAVLAILGWHTYESTGQAYITDTLWATLAHPTNAEWEAEAHIGVTDWTQRVADLNQLRSDLSALRAAGVTRAEHEALMAEDAKNAAGIAEIRAIQQQVLHRLDVIESREGIANLRR